MVTPRGDAEVRLGVGAARLTLRTSAASPAGALRINAYLPGNVRHAGPAGRHHLVADAWLAPEALSSSMREFRVAVRRARPRRHAWHPSGPIRVDAFEALFEGLAAAHPAIDVVPRRPGWEFGARVRGQRVAVRVSPEPDGLRLHRVVVDAADIEGQDPDGPVHDAALRLNARIRFARFALHRAGLAVEARLSDGLLDLARLVESVHAVAVVSRELAPMLELLSRHRGVARCYAHVFHNQNPKEHAS